MIFNPARTETLVPQDQSYKTADNPTLHGLLKADDWRSDKEETLSTTSRPGLGDPRRKEISGENNHVFNHIDRPANEY